MKLRNKKTGEIGELKPFVIDEKIAVWIENKSRPDYRYKTLAELNEEWEDYEEPKEGWCIDYYDAVKVSPKYDALIKEAKLIGNYFETKEEAEKAVEKLKAWKRLKEAGFEFDGWTHTPITKSLTGYNLHIKAYSDKLADYMDDLQLLFGGKK